MQSPRFISNPEAIAKEDCDGDKSRMTMGYDLLVVGEISFAWVQAALARISGVPVDAVDVAGEDAGDRDWRAAVLCTCAPQIGDITWSLDIYVSDAAGVQRSAAETAEELAYELKVPVLYDAGGVRPSAYWLAAPDGPRTRARVYGAYPRILDTGFMRPGPA